MLTSEVNSRWLANLRNYSKALQEAAGTVRRFIRAGTKQGDNMETKQPVTKTFKATHQPDASNRRECLVTGNY